MFCGKCGKNNSDEALFCKECGASLQTPRSSGGNAAASAPASAQTGRRNRLVGIAAVAVIAVIVLIPAFRSLAGEARIPR